MIMDHGCYLKQELKALQCRRQLLQFLNIQFQFFDTPYLIWLLDVRKKLYKNVTLFQDGTPGHICSISKKRKIIMV